MIVKKTGMLVILSVFVFMNVISIWGVDLDIYSPINDRIYKSRIININLSVDEKVSFIVYSDNGGRFRTLCRNCNNYGFNKIKKKIFKEDFHNITFIAVSGLKKAYQTISFIIDSKKPKILRIGATKNRESNGKEFYIRYSESNLQNISLFYGLGTEKIIKKDCPSGNRRICVFSNIDLTEYDGQEIYYWFEISDNFNSVKSRKKRIKVDVTAPDLILNMPNEGKVYDRGVIFNLSVSEKVRLEYYDYLGNKLKWRILCNRCDEYGFDRVRKKMFKKGEHKLLIRAVDKAGNFDIEKVGFCVGDECWIEELEENHNVGLKENYDGFGHVIKINDPKNNPIEDDVPIVNCSSGYDIKFLTENLGDFDEEVNIRLEIKKGKKVVYSHYRIKELDVGETTSSGYKNNYIFGEAGDYIAYVDVIIDSDVDLSNNIAERKIDVVC